MHSRFPLSHRPELEKQGARQGCELCLGLFHTGSPIILLCRKAEVEFEENLGNGRAHNTEGKRFADAIIRSCMALEECRERVERVK